MTTQQTVHATSAGLTVAAHRGDRSVLLAFDLPAEKVERLAGFTIEVAPPGKTAYPLPNRLSFAHAVTSATTAETRKWFPSTEAPFQKFRWVDVPPTVLPGPYEYRVTARYFGSAGELTDGPSSAVQIDLLNDQMDRLEVGFTRGYISSQAYADRFNNAPIAPDPPTMDFDTKPFGKRYEWLGFHGRELLFRFLADCTADPTISIDAFAYDLNEPDVIRALARLGPRLRLFLDNSKLHVDQPGKSALEPKARAAIVAAGAQVKTGHFGRFAHDKVFIARRNDQAVRVLTGSANFSVRGLYVQANNVLVFDAQEVASFYKAAFDQSWQAPAKFKSAHIAQAWFDLPTDGLPIGRVAFSPHASGDLSLGPVAASIGAAKSSVMFAVMELGGGGEVLAALRDIAGRSDIFSYGVTQSSEGFSVHTPGSRRGILVPFGFLSKQVPAPFRTEWNGGRGQVIHHKFVVVDFNGDSPVVYTGSSNLARGGEQQNGDNLLELHGRPIASLYAVEAVRQIDHYHFRAVMKNATGNAPLVLKGPADWQKWVGPYYDPNDLKSLDRELFVRG